MIQQAVLADYEKVVDRATIAVSDLRRISKLFFAHNSKVSTRKFGKLAPLKLLPVSKGRGLVS
jgi:hypothetical protein